MTLFIVLVALLIGSFVMLPDDFEILHNQSWPQIYSRTMYCKQ
ncbi:MAG: hypothetical protein N838_34190 [Thiohalocapsa sp. PB-PSB1]|nr:MAG: hypothetical protein N838_34190 [Thiohalocapsa sp. PB-PSB1]